MTLLINISTAVVAFITAVWILSSNYKKIWPAPNFVTHSATYDFIFQNIASNLFSDPIEYSYKSSPIPTCSSKLITSLNSNELYQHQLLLEKQSNLHHLLHIPPWALVPDRIKSHSGSVDDLYKTFDSLNNKQLNTLSGASELIEISPTDAVMKTHMESLSMAQRYWIKNMTSDLFNSSQTIFSYQLINYADEIQEWIQNSPYSNDYLRLIFERTRGWPLLYNPSIPQQTDNLSITYHKFCSEIINNVDLDLLIDIHECELFLDTILPWMPDRTPTLTTMWPIYYDINNLNKLKDIEGINDPYTLVIKQNRKPSGELLHYVSPKGDERIQVEWFNEEYHLRATNLAFVRRIRIQIKRISSILKNSVTLSSDLLEEGDDLVALWASLEDDGEEGPKPSDRHIEQLPFSFKEYIKNYAAELEKGQFQNIIQMDLQQNNDNEDRDIFIHGLPTIAAFNDGGIKRAWNFIIGIIDHKLIKINNYQLSSGSGSFLKYINYKNIQSNHHQMNYNHNIEFEILGIWPYAIGGYLRVITPEISIYKYPHYNDAASKFGKQRYVLLLDVLDKLYTNNMREIGIQRLKDNNNAKLLTLQSTINYLSYLLNIEHFYFNNMDDYTKQYTFSQGLFIRLTAFIECIVNDNDKYSCLLSGIMYNIIEGLNRNNKYCTSFIAFLENENIIKWDKNDNNKDIIDIIDKNEINNLLDTKLWDKWKNKYFNSDNKGEEKIEEITNNFLNDNENMKLYKRMIRHISPYSIVRRPGEDTYALEF